MKFTDVPATFYRTRARRASRIGQELIVDNFAGGGGASLGIELATGRAVDISINHDPDSVEMHGVNHPASRHLCESVWKVDPVEATNGRPVGLAWFSPDCRHFSRAKGGKPVKKNVRGLAWVVVKWAKAVRPRVIILENVREFQDWGPLTIDFMPCLKRKGDTFRRWWRSLERLGYIVEKRILDAADYGAPTHRKRLFVIARCDGQPIVWPERTHGPVAGEQRRGWAGGQKLRNDRGGVSEAGGRQDQRRPHPTDLREGGAQAGGRVAKLRPYRTAAECIDWTIPCPSIFDRKRPLAEKTLRRIAMGLKRYVLEAASPFIVKINHGKDEFRGQDLGRPLTTVTGSHGHALVTPYVVRTDHHQSHATNCFSAQQPIGTITSAAGHAIVTPYVVGVGGPSYAGKPAPVDGPLGSIMTENHRAVVAPTLIQTGFGERDGQAPRALDLHKPLGTVCATQKHALVAAMLTKHYGGVIGHGVDRPIGTVTAIDHHSVTAAFLARFNHGDKQWNGVDEPAGTITSQGNKFGLVYAFLMKFFGSGGQWQTLADPLHTITGRDRFGLVTVEVAPGRQEPAVWVDVPGIGPCLIADIGMRMLSPRELLAAQFGPELAAEYVLTGSKANQVHKIGNSVCPAVARALVEANFERAGAEVAA